MEKIGKIKAFLLFDTYGNISLASFLVCVISGVILAVPYDVAHAYDSIGLLLITNPPAVFFRNLHYWSAQYFLIFTLWHAWDRLKIRSTGDYSRGVWFRLVLSLHFTFFVMLSGFILKGDAESMQAFRILRSLLREIPLAGNFFSTFLLGDNEQLNLIYLHHAATATLFLLFIIFEHSYSLWTNYKTFLIALAVLTIFGFFFQALLHNPSNQLIKGPWYFVGLQEMLHWTGRTRLILLFVFLLFLMLYLYRELNEKPLIIFNRIILLISFFYLVLTLIGLFFRGEDWRWQWPWKVDVKSDLIPIKPGIRLYNARFDTLTATDIPIIDGKRETCMVCHKNVKGFSSSHDPTAIGCTSCHLGNSLTTTARSAHKNMVLVPGNLNVAGSTCGTTDCHPDITQRIGKSLMTTNSGIVSVDRFVFGESLTPDNHSDIEKIGFSAADSHLRNLCAGCHLGNEKNETGPISEMTRGGGCTACHLNYSRDAIELHNKYLADKKQESSLPGIHPSLDIRITNNHCFGCHNRSGRISTNYEGWNETQLDSAEIKGREGFRIIQDQRVFEFVGEDVHHKAGLECIDCHNSYEVMGDGNSYLHEENAVKIRCEDCHFKIETKTITYDQLDAETKKIFDLRKFKHKDKKMINAGEADFTFVNTYIYNDTAFLVEKNSGKIHLMKAPARVCTRNKVHENLSCSACHTAWAPTCIGCHNTYDPQSRGYDLLENKYVNGEWVEYTGVILAEAPSLGVRVGKSNKILPAVPGMILTIDKSNYTSDVLKSAEDSIRNFIFHRLYVPAEPHTTTTKGRACKSCHNDPVAIGYGRGQLTYHILNGHAKWEFKPFYAASKYDELPEDAWIGFLTQYPGTKTSLSTRLDFRPFTIEEQKQILTVGACLTCHDEDSQIMIKSLDRSFDQTLNSVSKQCILPEW